MTTQAIADRAGVSVGTLYQYFSDREAVLDALREQVIAEEAAAVAAVMAQVIEARPTFDEALARLMDTVFALVSVRPELMRRLLLDTHAPGSASLFWREQATQLVRGLLYGGPEHVRRGNVDVMATLIVSAVFGMARDVVAHRPELMQTPELRAEMTLLVRRFLEPP